MASIMQSGRDIFVNNAQMRGEMNYMKSHIHIFVESEFSIRKNKHSSILIRHIHKINFNYT